ncbi:Cullin-domain-containing protein [Cryphonectria parasitica EP155]|uniref:Cullin-domain-containing protein n=1 Tax=Cryphonectria parasitica (strain ATCC 38755 / EP155) TaxID=660469 RepID=A0A9P4XWK5_CRYP1|nr:Cullin-domain-containing protein [Cryphonectria parasitica EP155]KAF3762637.1 Cullin-domain-containing protein [Cryphonectria parasitica EP155]
MMHRSSNKIRPPRKPVGRGSPNGQLTEEQEFEACWSMLCGALTDIHRRDAGKLSFEQLYRASYKIVIKRRGLELYEKVGAFEEKWFRDEVIPPIYELVSGKLVNLALGDLPGTSTNERREMGEKFLKGMRDSWERHVSAMGMITDIMMYLDRGQVHHADQTSDRPPLYMVVLGLYRDNILRFEFPSIEGPLTNVINAVVLDLINMDRDGEIVDRNLVKRVLVMYEQLAETDETIDDNRLYITTFEPAYIEAARQYYAQEADRLLQDGDAGTWIRQTNRRLQEEVARCETTVSKLSQAKILAVVEDELISKHLDKFLALETTGLRAMIDNDRFEDLSILYRLVSRPGVKNGIDKLKKILSVRIVELGVEIEKGLTEANLSGSNAKTDEDAAPTEGAEKTKALTGTARQTAAAVKWVDNVLRLKFKFDKYLSDCFEGCKILESAVTKSFADFINLFPRCAEVVSLFIDDTLKNGMREKSEAEIDATMDRAITLIRYLQDRDMFQRYYQKHLGRRLLHGKNESHEAEKQLISRMKQEIGSHFTSKFEGMFKDMDTSADLTSGYRDHIRALGDVDRKNVELTINVLTSNNWPSDSMYSAKPGGNDGLRVECTWPVQVKRLQESFLKYYLSERNGRVLTWMGSLGTADIKCVFPKVPDKDSGPLSKERRYELTVSTYGMVVLMMFNELPEGEWLSYEDIRATTNIPTGELNRTLASLSLAPRSKVLLKEPMNKTIKSGDKFAYNNSFASKTVKIRAPIVSAQSKVEDMDERKETEKRNDESRAHIVDAAIVRIMKARKELPHNRVITEVINVLHGRFKPDVSLVKKRIEDLISREYLERAEISDATQQVYRYLA